MSTRWLPALVMVAALTSCSDAPEQTVTPTKTPERTEPTEPDETTDEPSISPTDSPGPALLDWQPVPGPVSDEVTVSGEWTLTLPEGGGTASLAGPEPQDYDAPRGYRFTDALIDGEYAVVVLQHEQATAPNVVSVVELATGETFEADLPADAGGDFALGSGLLALTATTGGAYCVTIVDLVTDRSRRGPCVPARHGISNLRITSAGVSAMTFDDGRPSCRTLNRIEGTTFEPLPGVGECHGWEAVVTETSAIWGVVPEERRIEASEYFADSGSGPAELGPGTTGSLTWCGDAAYVVREPQRSSDPARLLRIDPAAGTTEVVYESAGTGRAFLSAPRCGGADLTLTALTAAGDEQVTASVR